MPQINTAMVFGEQPFHSFSMIPHTLENTTLSAMRIQKESVISVGDDARNPLPSANPKNCEYHSAPARRQKKRLLNQIKRRNKLC